MTDIAELEIRIDSDQARNALDELLRRTRRLEDGQGDLRRRQDDTNRSTRTLASGFKLLGAAIAGVAVGQIVSGFTDAARALERMQAQLETATGSATAATAKFAELTAFAQRTPFDLEQSVEGFVKLTNLGLEPTEAALTSFGNTAVAMGKDLNQMIEAVADASTFEFERLKEFGIKSRQEADSVIFTFRGVSTEVGKSSEEIVEYLTNIGETTFAGAMEAQMKGVTGAMANLNAATGALSRVFIEALAPAFARAINVVASFVEKVADATREILEFFGVIESRNLEELNEQLDEANVRWESHAVILSANAQGWNYTSEQIEAARKGLMSASEDIAHLEGRINSLRRPMEVLANKPRVITEELDDMGGSLGKVAVEADKARMSLTQLIVDLSSYEVRDLFVPTAEDIAEIDSFIEDIWSPQKAEELSFDFSSKFWDVFANQGEFSIQSLVGVFQSWGLEIAQSDVFKPLFDSMSAGIGTSLNAAIGTVLSSYGVGTTAGQLAGGGIQGGIAGAISGGFTGFQLGGPVGAGIGAILGGLGGSGILGGGGGDNRYSFSLFGGLGQLAGSGGPGAPDFSRFVESLNQLEIAMARTLSEESLSNVIDALEDFRSAQVRMKEGTFNAEQAFDLASQRLFLIAREMPPQFNQLFKELTDGTAASAAEAVESLLAVREAMSVLDIGFRDVRQLIEENALFGESYAETLTRIVPEQLALKNALEETEEVIEEVTEEIENVAAASWDASRALQDLTRLYFQFIDFLYEIEDALNATTGALANWEVSFSRFQDAVSAFQFAVGAGASIEVQMEIFQRGFAAFQQAFAQAMAQINANLQEEVNEIREKYADLGDKIRQTFDLRRRGLEEELILTQEWASTLSSVTGIIESLRTGPASPLGLSGQFAAGQSNLAQLRAQFAGATGAERAAIGSQLAQALQQQLQLGQGLFGQGSIQYFEQFNDTMQELSEIQAEAAREAARQTAIEEELRQLQHDQTAALEKLNEQMQEEIDAANERAQRQIDALNNYAQTVYAEFERVGQRLYREMLQQRLEQAEQERQGLAIQHEQLGESRLIRIAFQNAGLLNPAAAARVQAKQGKFV